MTEVWFYHLETRALEDVLPALLEKTLARGWRAVIQCGSQERVEALDRYLWTFDDASFLPHGTLADGRSSAQPIYLTTETDNPNSAEVRFLVDSAESETFEGYDRLVYIFDGADSMGVQRARQSWKDAKASGADVTYWRQDGQGRWQKHG